jgi:CheY-like chemotaxis protein
MKIFGTSTFTKLTINQILPKWNDSEYIKKIAEIAIVDDNPNDFPTADLRKAGYRVKTYKQVTLNDISRLAEYDVVFLDIHGIVKDDIEEGGLKLLPKLRDANPQQKICAVSSRAFDPTATAFFKRADDVQKKPVNAQKCQEVIDALALEKLNPSTLASHLDNETKQLNTYSRRVLIYQVRKFAASTKPYSEMSIHITAAGKLSSVLHHMLMDYMRILRYATN